MTPTSINHILQAEKQKVLAMVNTDYKSRKPFYNISKLDFYNLLKYKVQQELVIRKKSCVNFDTHDHQLKLIENFYYYFTNNKNFEGDLQKGIYLSGPKGTGKSLLLTSFINCYSSFGKIIQYRSCKKLGLTIKSIADINSLSILPMMLDDIGRETTESNDYAAKIRPIGDLIYARYDIGALTFGTSNKKIKSEELTKKYGETVVDRMVEMFNEFELKGNSLRK